MKRLGVNIDHVATVRNARGEFHPDPYKAALFVKKKGADSITIHLREDRRHIRDLDAKKICSIKKLLVNLEISTNSINISVWLIFFIIIYPAIEITFSFFRRAISGKPVTRADNLHLHSLLY